MIKRKRCLNKGIETLLAETLGYVSLPLESVSDVTRRAETVIQDIPKSTYSFLDKKRLEDVSVTRLNPGRFQQRKNDKIYLKTLADSIRMQGVLQPIVVRKIDNSGFEIIAGARRWQAAQMAGFEKVPVIVRAVSDESALAIGLIENIQRENLNPIEEATGLECLLKKFFLTHQSVAEVIGKSRSAVSNLLRLLSLRVDVKVLLEQGKICIGHAKLLLTVVGLKQSQLAKIVVEKTLSVRETEALITRECSSKSCYKLNKEDPDISLFQTSLTERIGFPVKIHHSMKGKGRIVIKYGSLEELECILTKIE